MNDTGDYYATLRVQQGRIRQAMSELGIKTASELARRAGVSASGVGKLLNFRVSPRNSVTGAWITSAQRIAAALAYHPSELFPEYLGHVVAKNVMSGYAMAQALQGSGRHTMLPDERVHRKDVRRRCLAALKMLSPRESSVLYQRYFENKTLSNVRLERPVSKCCVRQIEAKALMKLRHPKRIRMLDELVQPEK